MAERNGIRYPICYGANGRIYEVNPFPTPPGGVLPGWRGNENWGCFEEELSQRLNDNHQNSNLPDEEIAPPLVRSGRPDPTL